MMKKSHFADRLHTLAAVACLAAFATPALAQAEEAKPAAEAPDPKTAEGTVRTKIINGVEAPEGRLPWQVSLFSVAYGHFCGGTLIGDDWVVTAAHCITYRDEINPEFRVLEKTNSLLTGGDVREVVKVIKHAGYDNDSKVNDIALLKLAPRSEEVRSAGRLGEAVIALDNGATDRQAAAYTKATVSGYGLTSERGNISAKLMMVDVPMVDIAVCNSADVYDGLILPGMMCAGKLQPDSEGELVDSCQGDSGGPLVSGVGTENPRLVGVVSWGFGCARPNKPGVYTRVASFYDWIKENMQ